MSLTWIEEAMIAANVHNARWLKENARTAICFHIHATPSPENIARATRFAKATEVKGTEDRDPRWFVENVLARNEKRRRWAEEALRRAMPKSEYALEP